MPLTINSGEAPQKHQLDVAAAMNSLQTVATVQQINKVDTCYRLRIERRYPSENVMLAILTYLQVSPQQLQKLAADPGPQALLFEQLQSNNMPAPLNSLR